MKFVLLCLSLLAVNIYAQKEGAPCGSGSGNVYINLRHRDKHWKLVDNWQCLPVKLAHEYKSEPSSGAKRYSGHSYAPAGSQPPLPPSSNRPSYAPPGSQIPESPQDENES